jgi:hypothetical protein
VSILEGAKSGSGLDDLLRNDLERDSVDLTSTRNADQFDEPVDVVGRGHEEENFAAFHLKKTRQVSKLVSIRFQSGFKWCKTGFHWGLVLFSKLVSNWFCIVNKKYFLPV